MRGKLAFLSGIAVGFVLGTREGRERYDQLVRKTRQVLDHPTVQEAKGVVQAQANRLYEESRGVVSDKLSHTKVGGRMLTGHRNGSDLSPSETVTPAGTSSTTTPVGSTTGSTTRTTPSRSSGTSGV